MVPVIIGVATAVISGIGYLLFKEDDNKEPTNKYHSTILLGPQASGKTHLANWLSKKELLKEYVPTYNKIEISGILDIFGGEAKVRDWENLIKDKKNIFYLFDSEKFFNKTEYSKTTYNKIVGNHISLITEHLKQFTNGKKIIIIGTHCDKFDLQDETKNRNEIVQELSEVLGESDIIFGSLADKEKAKKIEEEINKFL